MGSSRQSRRFQQRYDNGGKLRKAGRHSARYYPVTPMIMNVDRREFLLVIRMPPARLDVPETAWYLGFMPHDIAVLVRAGLLKPLVRSPQATKYFATVTLAKLREDPQWLAKASEAITRHWRAKNQRNNVDSAGRAPVELAETTADS